MKNFLQNQDKRKRDNRGMTLLEVILAVAIFSIAAMVLFRSFVTSGRINRKSNLYLEATSTAQNVMEEIKAKTFTELAAAFLYPIDRTDGSCRFSFLEADKALIATGELGIKEVLLDNGEYKDVRPYRESDGEDTSKVTASVISKDGGATYLLNPRTKGENASRYYFQMTNVTNLHETFDVLAEFDGSSTSGYKKDSILDEDQKNDYLMPNIAKLDTRTNAFLIMEKMWDENAMKTMTANQLITATKMWNDAGEEYQASHPLPQTALTTEEVYGQTKRILTIKLEQSGGVVTAKAKYTLCAYDYKKEGGTELESMGICPCGGQNVDIENPEDRISGCFCTYESAYTTFYSSEADADLKSVYAFYYPNYNSTGSTDPLDVIEFDNNINLPVKLYVTKQREESQELPTSTQERRYRMALNVYEQPESNWNTNPGLFRSNTILRTNLDYDISDPENAESRPKISQMRLTFQDSRLHRKVTGNSAKSVLSLNGLDDKKAEDRIYSVKVSVYKAGAAAKNFPEDELIATLDGAKED